MKNINLTVENSQFESGLALAELNSAHTYWEAQDLEKTTEFCHKSHNINSKKSESSPLNPQALLMAFNLR